MVALAWTLGLAVLAIVWVTLGLWAGDHVMPRLWVRGIFLLTGVRVSATRDPSVDPLAPCVLVSNHRSVLDGLVIVATTRRMPRFVAKASVGRIPLIGLAFRRLGHVLIDRSDPAAARQTLADAARRIGHRWSLYVAPEGTFARPGRGGEDPTWVGPFKSGAFAYARLVDLPVVPVALVGTDRVWPPGRFGLRPGRVVVRYGPPLRDPDADRLREAARAWIVETLEHELGGEPPVQVGDRPVQAPDDGLDRGPRP